MSIRRITAVLDSKTTTGNDRVCLIVLADKADDDGFCWPGLTAIQEQMNSTRQTALNALRRLEASGELYSVRIQRKGSKHLVLPGLSDDQIVTALINRFEMSEQEARKQLVIIHENRNKSTNHTSKKSTNHTSFGTQKKSTNHTKKVYGLDQNSLKPRLDPSLPVIDPSEKIYLDLLDAWYDGMPSPPVRRLYEKYEDAATSLINAGYTADQVAAFVKSKYVEEWWQGKFMSFDFVEKNLPQWVAANYKPPPPPAPKLTEDEKRAAIAEMFELPPDLAKAG